MTTGIAVARGVVVAPSVTSVAFDLLPVSACNGDEASRDDSGLDRLGLDGLRLLAVRWRVLEAASGASIALILATVGTSICKRATEDGLDEWLWLATVSWGVSETALCSSITFKLASIFTHESLPSTDSDLWHW